MLLAAAFFVFYCCKYHSDMLMGDAIIVPKLVCWSIL